MSSPRSTFTGMKDELALTNERAARHQSEVRRRSGPYSHARLLALTPDSANHIQSRSFRHGYAAIAMSSMWIG